MSKNQLPAHFQATKKPNPVFRLDSRFRYQAGTKLSSNLQSQNVLEQLHRLFASGIPFAAGRESSAGLLPVNSRKALFFKNLSAG